MGKWQYSKPVLVTLGLLVLLLAHSVWALYQKNQITLTNREELEDKVKVMEGREADLEARINALKTSRGLEEEMRRSLPVAGPGEEVITLVDQPVAATTTTSTSWWARLFGQ